MPQALPHHWSLKNSLDTSFRSNVLFFSCIFSMCIKPKQYVHDSPALVLNGREATPKMHAFLIRSLTNFMNDEAYNLHKQCCAFFQGGYNDPNGGFFYIEFWKGAKAQPYIEWLNRNAPAFTQ